MGEFSTKRMPSNPQMEVKEQMDNDSGRLMSEGP